MANENSKMNQALETAIEDHLNEAQLGVFRREMDRLQGVEAEFTALRETYKDLVDEHRETLTALHEQRERMDDVEHREKNLAAREKEMAAQKTALHIENQLIDLRRTNAEQRVEDHKNMVGLVFRSPAFKQSISENTNRDVITPIPISDNGAAGYTHRENANESKTVVTEITEK